MACGNHFNRYGRKGICGCGRRNYYPNSGLGAYADNRNGWNNGCGCRKSGTFVDYMPVVVDYRVTPMNYSVMGRPEPVRGYLGANNYAREAAVADDLLDDGFINGSNRRHGKCGCDR